MCSLVLPGCCWVCCQAGWGGGGGGDAGSGPSHREFPHGEAYACTPRQGVTLLYGPSICTRSVQMDLRRNQVRSPFPTPGSGTLWVSGESLRDRRVSCLPQWRLCPTRSPSQDANRSTGRGKCSWSGPWATPPGRGHLGPLANGPGRNPPYCLRSGGADTDTGGGSQTPEVGYLTSVFCELWSSRPPPVRCGVGPCLPALFPGGVSLSRAPCRASWLLPCPVCPCCLSLLGRVGVLCFFSLAPPPLTTRLSTGVSVCPLPPPMSPRRLFAVLAPFLGGWGRRGSGGGASSLSVLWRKHVADMAQARGAALVPLQVWGGGLPCSSRRRPSYPAFAPPVSPPVGACTARASYGHGRVVRPAPSLRCLPTLPLCPREGGGAVRPSLPSPPNLGGAEVCVWGGACRLPFVARMSQAQRKQGAGMRRGTCPSAGGGGMPCGSRRRPSYPAFAPPVDPPLGLARRVLSSGTVVWSVPHPLAAASRPCRFVPGGGGRFSPPPTCISHPWGGGSVWGGGGLVVFPS